MARLSFAFRPSKTIQTLTFNLFNIPMILPSRQILPAHAECGLWRWALFGGVLGLLLATVLLAPASWLAAALQRATSGRIQMVESVGTVWTGSGRLRLQGGPGSRDRATLPDRVSWKLRPESFKLELELLAVCCTSQPMKIRMQPRWGGVSLQIDDSASEWPAFILTGLGTPWNTFQANGSLRLMTQGLSFEWFRQRFTTTGQAQLTAVDLTTSLNTLKPTGSYQLSLLGGKTNEFKLSTLEGGLQLSGNGRWAGQQISFEGFASAAPGHEAALANLLNIIGRRNGRHSIITLG